MKRQTVAGNGVPALAPKRGFEERGRKKAIGRPASLSSEQRTEVIERLKGGESVSALSRAYRTSRQTIMRVRGTMVERDMVPDKG